MKKSILLSVSAALIISMAGCANPNNMSDSDRTKAEGTGIGVLGGAILGAIIGGDSKGAAIGAAVGGVAGYAYGSHVANEKAKYASQEDWLDACIVNAKKVNKDIIAYNAKVQKKIDETKKLVALYKNKKASKAKMLAQKKLIDSEKKKADEMLKMAMNELKLQQDVLRDAKKSGKKTEAARLEKEIAIMERENNTLKEQTDTLASLSALTSV